MNNTHKNINKFIRLHAYLQEPYIILRKTIRKLK